MGEKNGANTRELKEAGCTKKIEQQLACGLHNPWARGDAHD